MTAKDKKILALIAGLVFLFLLTGVFVFYLIIQRVKEPLMVSLKPKSSTQQAQKKGEGGEAGKTSAATQAPGAEVQDPQAFASYEYKDPFQPLTGVSAVPTSTQTAENQKKRLSLQDISSEGGVKYASVKYGGVVYKVKEGDRVDESPYQVLSIGDNSVTLLFGDEQVSLQMGQEIIK